MNTPPWETQQQEGTTRLTSTREEMTVIIGALCVAPSDVRGMPISALGVPTAYPTRQSGGLVGYLCYVCIESFSFLGTS